MRKPFLVALFLGVFVPIPGMADDTLAKFDGGIGVIPVSAGPAPNTVRGTNPGGQPWVIADLSATVTTDGEVTVEGKGLLLGGGNSIGTTGGQSVRATLFCANDGNVAHSSGAVPLEANGDFKIDDVLTPTPPNPCAGAVLLIRSAGNGNWFAAGIPKVD